MNTLLHWLTSPEWALVVKTLLHSLWQGAAISVALALLLRRVASPEARYRIAVTGLGAVLLSAMITWGVLNVPKPSATPVAPMPELTVAETPVATGPVEKIVIAANWTPARQQTQWTAWLALAWLLGASAMLGRASVKVAGAEQLRRSCQPLTDPRIAELVAEARRAVKLTRQVRVAVTNQLTSPAVVGALVPTLILPLSLITTLSPEQIRFVLLHELAHIRRGDYLANLFQLFAEALLFFNPAVWWLSHQIRREREACCDALAIQLSGAPADYARTLVSVAETILMPPPAAAPAFGNEREPSSLSDRVQRVLVPGYRPSLRLTWRAMLTALVVGGVLLGLSAIGTRVTVAAAAKLLTPQERMEQIEKKMVEHGQKPVAEKVVTGRDWNDSERIPVTAQVRTADGSPLPKQRWAIIHSRREKNSGSSAVNVSKDGRLNGTVWPGQVWIEITAKGFAPTIVGPIDAWATNRIDAGDIVLERGFGVSIEVVDAMTGEAVGNAPLRASFSIRGTGSSVQNSRELMTDATGRTTLTNCVDQPLGVTVNMPGYEFVEQKFETIKAGQTLRVAVRRGGIASGVVLDKASGGPLAGVKIGIYHSRSPEGGHGFGWDNSQGELATTDNDGRFNIQQLRNDSRYWLGVTAPGRESVLLADVRPGKTNLVVRLGPELIVKCRVVGDLAQLSQNDGKFTIGVELRQSQIEDSISSWTHGFEVKVRDGVGHFQFTNRLAAPVTISTGGRKFQRIIDAPVDDWLIDLTQPAPTNAPVPTREVVFRFKHASGVPPRGTVDVSIPTSTDQNRPTARSQEMEIRDGEVRAEMAIGGYTSIEPKKTVGYWFKNLYSSVVVTNGEGPMVIEISTIPAGVITAKAVMPDGTVAHEVWFTTREIKPSPQRDGHGSMSGGVNSATTKWISGPLPLGGIYQIVGYRGNSFCISEPIALTGEKPTAEVELKFPVARSIECRVLDAGGQPVKDAEVESLFSLPGHGFGLRGQTTDDDGRFRIADVTPGVGEYTVQVKAPNLQAEWVTLDFSSPVQTIRLARGRTLGGRVVEAGTGHPIPDVEVRAADMSSFKLPMLKTETDADGRFEFTTLGDVEYQFYVEDGQSTDAKKFRANGSTNLTLTVKLYDWSKSKPKPPVAAKQAVGTNLLTRTFKVDTNEFARALGMAGPVTATNFQSTIRNFFSSLGVDLSAPGKSVFYGDRRGMLLVRATLADLDIIEQALQVMNEPPPQVNIRAKFIEMPGDGSGNLFLGTLGSAFTNSNGGKPANMGGNAIGPAGTNNPKVAGLTGILTPAQFKVVLRALEQREGVEILSAPDITTVSGRQAQLQVVDIRTIVSGLSTVTATNGTSTNLFQTSALPFGPVLDVVPYVSADGFTVQMALISTVTEFIGYQKPAPALTKFAKEKSLNSELPLPIYRVRQATTSAVVRDGQTIVIGGFISETVTQHSDGSNTRKPDPKEEKKHLFVFITPTIIDPAGNRVHADEGMPSRTNSVPKQPGK